MPRYETLACPSCGATYEDLAGSSPRTCDPCVERQQTARPPEACRCCGWPTDPRGKRGFCRHCEPRLDSAELAD